jgi:hypothetical protein
VAEATRIELKLSAEWSEYVRVPENGNAEEELSAFVEGRAQYASDWVKTESEMYVRRDAVVAAQVSKPGRVTSF